jgi:glutamate synthase (NADPH/NADH) large chain
MPMARRATAQVCMSICPCAFSTTPSPQSGHKPLPNRFAVGMVFLPRTDLGAQEMCRTIVEAEIIEAGYTIYGWRQVPVDVSVIGEKAKRTRPEIEQIMIAGPMPEAKDMAEFEKELYLIRRRIEKKVVAAQINDFYVCSLSCRSIIYKGLFLAESLSDLLSRPDGRPLRKPGRDLPPALFDQHLPAMVAGAAVPHAGA